MPAKICTKLNDLLHRYATIKVTRVGDTKRVGGEGDCQRRPSKLPFSSLPNQNTYILSLRNQWRGWWRYWWVWSSKRLWSFTKAVEQSNVTSVTFLKYYTLRQQNRLQLSPLKQGEKLFQEKCGLKKRGWCLIKLWKLEHQWLWIFHWPVHKDGPGLKDSYRFKNIRFNKYKINEASNVT